MVYELRWNKNNDDSELVDYIHNQGTYTEKYLSKQQRFFIAISVLGSFVAFSD